MEKGTNVDDGLMRLFLETEKLTALFGEDSYLVNKEIISYMDEAHKAWWDGRYEDALALCQKAMKRKKGLP